MYYVTIFAQVWLLVTVSALPESYRRAANLLELIMLKRGLLYVRDIVSDDYFCIAISELCNSGC